MDKVESTFFCPCEVARYRNDKHPPVKQWRMSNVKNDLIFEIEKRVNDKILEPSNAELLKKLIQNADSDNEAMSIAELGTTYKRTGLHFDKRLEKFTKTIRYFKKNEKLSFHTDDDKPTHKLIIGDNYEALQNLLIQYKGKIDVIYIDPPYGKDSMGEFAKTNYENAITRDNLLSMLYPRLMLAKMLLNENGIIFCSIDDKNQAYVKCLFDEVFGENNFLTCICVNRPSEIASNYVVSKHEYIVTYCRDSSSYELSNSEKYTISRGTVGNIDQTMPIITFPKGLKCYGIKDGVYNETRKIEGSRENIENLDPIVVENGQLKNDVRLKARWRSSNDMRNFFQNNCQATKAKINGFIEEIYFENDRFNPQIKKLTYEKIPSSLSWNDNKKGSSTLTDLELDFDFPKSTDLVNFVLNYAKDNSIVLDFFAGSGTTGHAVLESNKKDEGNRTFIICQLNEITDTTPNGIAYDVTTKRLKRIMTGECYDGTNDFEWIKKNVAYGGNLDVYEIEQVSNFEHLNGKTPFDVIDESLYGINKFDSLQDKIEWICSNFSNTQNIV